MPLRKVKFKCSIFLLAISLPGFCLPSDKEQVMQVLSDSADLNQQSHRGIYKGHVEFTQGSINLRAAKAFTQGTISNQLTLAIAKGSKKEQAHYWMQTDSKAPPFHAYADIIRYYPLGHLIELIGHARIEQGSNSLSSAKISYDTLKQQVLSQSDGKTRTTIILYPEKKPL